MTLRSCAAQATKKFVFAEVQGSYKAAEVKKALNMLAKAGIVIPVTHTSANGLPLGSEANNSFQKMLLLDTGLMLRLLNMTVGDLSTTLTEHILTCDAANLANKGPMAEMIAGLELLHYRTPNIRHELFYWTRQVKNSLAEIDYVSNYNQTILPLEIKSGTQGGMKSLWIFMREKKLIHGVRCSLENFGTLSYTDKEDDDAVRNVTICPLFAMSQLSRLLEPLSWEKTYFTT